MSCREGVDNVGGSNRPWRALGVLCAPRASCASMNGACLDRADGAGDGFKVAAQDMEIAVEKALAQAV